MSVSACVTECECERACLFDNKIHIIKEFEAVSQTEGFKTMNESLLKEITRLRKPVSSSSSSSSYSSSSSSSSKSGGVFYFLKWRVC